MFQFEEFLKELPVFLKDGSVRRIESHEIEEIATAHPIILMPKDGTSVVPILDESIPLDLPFKSCFFEFFDRPITSFDTEKDYKLAIMGIYIKEITPRNYHLLSLITSREGSAIHFISDEKIQRHLLSMVNVMLERFYSEKIGYSAIRKSVKLKTGARYRIGRVIYIAPKSSAAGTDRVVGKHIEWTHRWHVRGHWRSIPNKIGKDREEKPMPNWTWVTQYIKGPEDAEVILKPHIVK